MATNPNFSLNKDANLADVNAVDVQAANNVLAGGSLYSSTGAVMSGGAVVVDAAINPAVANTTYLVGPITVNRAITLRPSTAGSNQTIKFKLVGANANNANLVFTSLLAAPSVAVNDFTNTSTLVSNSGAGNGPSSSLANNNNVFTLAGDNNGGGGIGSVVEFIQAGTTWQCKAHLVNQGNASVLDASAFSG